MITANAVCCHMQVESSINLDNEVSIEGPKSGATFAGLFRPPSFGGRVSGLEAAPVLGSALGRVQGRVCAWLRSQRRRKVSQLWSCHCPTNLVADADLPFALRQSGSASELHGGEALSREPFIPSPIPATTEMVEHWISTHFQPLTNVSTKIPPEIGESVLWRGVKTGRRGHPSTIGI